MGHQITSAKIKDRESHSTKFGPKKENESASKGGFRPEARKHKLEGKKKRVSSSGNIGTYCRN
jgi:hypothetical protein